MNKSYIYNGESVARLKNSEIPDVIRWDFEDAGMVGFDLRTTSETMQAQFMFHGAEQKLHDNLASKADSVKLKIIQNGIVDAQVDRWAVEREGFSRLGDLPEAIWNCRDNEKIAAVIEKEVQFSFYHQRERQRI